MAEPQPRGETGVAPGGTRGSRAAAVRGVVGVAAAIVLADQATKAVITARLRLHDSIPVIDGFLDIVHVRNPGAAFSLLAGAPAWFRGPFFLAATVAATAALLYFALRLDGDERWMASAFGAVLGGAVGNLIDRVLYGEVIDFIDVHWRELHWPAFNVADSSISIAVAVVVLHSLFGQRAGAAKSRKARPSA